MAQFCPRPRNVLLVLPQPRPFHARLRPWRQAPPTHFPILPGHLDGQGCRSAAEAPAFHCYGGAGLPHCSPGFPKRPGHVGSAFPCPHRPWTQPASSGRTGAKSRGNTTSLLLPETAISPGEFRHKKSGAFGPVVRGRFGDQSAGAVQKSPEVKTIFKPIFLAPIVDLSWPDRARHCGEHPSGQGGRKAELMPALLGIPS